MGQAIAFCLIILFSGLADGIMDTFGPAWFFMIGAVVMGTAYILIWGGRTKVDHIY